MKKLYPLILTALFILSICLVPFVSATTTLTASNTGTVYSNTDIYAQAPFTFGGKAESFTVNTEGYLLSAEFYLKKNGAPDLILASRLVNSSTGTLTGNALFNEVLAESTSTLESTSLTTSYAWYSFNFNGTYLMHTGDVFFIVIYCLSFNGADGSNSVRVGYNLNGATGVSRDADGDNTWGTGSSANDRMYRVYVTDTLSATPTPTPAPTATPVGYTPAPTDNVSTVIDAVISNINVLIFLAVIFIFGVLGYGFAGAWGFFAGVNLAVIMLVLFGSLPFWVVIAMIVLDGLMFFGKAEIGKGNKKED